MVVKRLCARFCILVHGFINSSLSYSIQFLKKIIGSFRFQEDSPACFTNHSWRNGSGLGISDSCEGRRLRKCRKDAIPGTSSKQAPIRQYQTLSQTSSSVESDSLSNSVDLQLSKCGSKTNTFIECTKPNCNKKYKHLAGLQYHQSHAHKKVEKTTDHSSTLVSRPSCDNSKIRASTEQPIEEC